MTQDLYRKEALAHRSRALFGDVILRGPLSTWIVTGLLVIVMALILIGLLVFKIDTSDGPVTIFRWLLSQGRS